MRTPLNLALVASAGVALTACGGGDGNDPVPTPLPAPPATAAFNVEPCLTQQVAPGVTVASLVVPDVIKLDTRAASGFPNGRRLPDPVIDVTLAVIFLDLTRVPATALASIPINPAAGDLPFRPDFPYLGAPQGGVPITTGGTNYNFRTDAPSAYVSVDRMGMPAVATALVGSALKNAYNDDNPAGDATGRWAPEFTVQLGLLTAALADDFQRAGLPICARPRT